MSVIQVCRTKYSPSFIKEFLLNKAIFEGGETVSDIDKIADLCYID